MSSHVNFRREFELPEGLRSRKKARTRQVIEEVALELFSEQGFESTTVEQIAERAEISTTTFFRYFPSKADVALCQQDAQLPLLRRAILERPADENDVIVVRRAIEQVWVPAIDPERTLRTAGALGNSPTMRGIYDELNRDYVRTIANALAARRGLEAADENCNVIARMTIGIFGATVERWITDRCREYLGDAIRRNFDMAMRLASEASQAESRNQTA
jgi:AcrR family transcriptional regulator